MTAAARLTSCRSPSTVSANESIVRAGFDDGEMPLLTMKGTAKRGQDGTIQLPDGEPWGWAQAGDTALDNLRGLRSFTILGWLKPDSLQIGSGATIVPISATI